MFNGIKPNLFSECQELRWGLWQCPPFLFILMGLVTIVSMIATYALASRYIEEPQIAALVVIFVALLFFIVGNIIISGFNKMVETNRMKSEFIAIVSHQLRSPLSVFKWTTDVLERQLKAEIQIDTPTANYLDTLRSTTENMIALVNSLLEVTRIEARTFLLREEQFSLVDQTRSTVDNFIKYAEASNVHIAFEAEPNLPEVKADKERVGIIVQNLIDNSIRYTSKSGTIRIRITREKDSLKWSIQDEGIGVPTNQQRFIFQKFFRADNIKRSDSRTQTHGSGIGLFISKEIIEASGGHIGFVSEENKGSTFWFTLPLSRKSS